MVGNSASKPLNSTPNELTCITVDWWRIAWKKLYIIMYSRGTQHLIFQICVSKYLYSTYKTPFGKSGHICKSLTYIKYQNIYEIKQ